MPFSPYDYLRDQTQRRRREPWDERLPDGSTVQELLQRVQDPIQPQADPTLMTRPRTTAYSPLRELGDRIRADSEAVDKRAQDIGAMSHAEWEEAQRAGKIPVWTSHLQGTNTQTGIPDEPSQMTRPRRVFEQPPSTGTAGRPRYTDPVTYDSSGMPERRPHNYGAEPLDTAIKYRDALENWRPSGERSIGNTARGAGYGVLTAAEKFPGSGEALIGGGIAGLLASIFKPSSKNWMRRGLAIGQADAEVARQLKIAGDQAKIRQAELNPVFREQTLNQGQQRIDLNRDRLAQQNLLAHKRALASIFNAYPEFDPDDPKNAAIVAAMNAVGLPVTKKTRGSLLQLVQGTDAEGNATFSIVHKPSGTASQVTGEGLPAKTEGQLNREATRERQIYQQEQINKRQSQRGGTRGLTPGQVQARRDRASGLIAKIKAARQDAERLQGLANSQPQYKAHYEAERDKALQVGNEAAFELNEKYGDWYEAGPGQGGWPYFKEKPQSQASEDPKIRAYADQFFGGDYAAALEAIRKQRGQ